MTDPTQETALLTFSGITKSFFDVPVLKGINLQLKRASILALIGENGAGKSTLMNVLGGVLQADGGQIQLNGEPLVCLDPKDAQAKGIAFIHQELNLFSNLSVAENIFVNDFPRTKFTPFVNRTLIRNKATEALARVNLEVSPNELVENLPAGERQLVEIAKALVSNAKIIILDEPTTSLTTRETTRLMDLMRQLKAQGVSMIFISHALLDVKNIADEIAVLRDGEVIIQASNCELPIDAMIQHMVGRQLSAMFPKRSNRVLQNLVLSVRGVSQPNIVKDIKLHVCRGEIVGIFGLMGAGRSELLRIIFGLDPHEKGEIELSDKVLVEHNPRHAISQGMAFVTESRREDGIFMDLPVTDNVSIVRMGAFSRFGFLKLSQMKQAMLSQLKTSAVKVKNPVVQPIRSLSGGNQQKVVIGKWMINQPSLLILDEPTRGIDVAAKFEVYSQIQHLAQGGAGVLMASSELEELIGTCNRLIVMSRGEITGEFEQDQFDRERILSSAFGGFTE